MTKQRMLGLVALLVISAMIAAGQPWFSISVGGSSEPLQVKSYDGYTAYSFLMPLLLVVATAIVVSSFVSVKARYFTLGLATLANIFLTFSLALNLKEQRITGLSKQLEAATGIAVTHGLDGVGVLTEPAAWVSLYLCGAITLALLASLFTQRTWRVKPKLNEPAKVGATKIKKDDSISLWDSQR